MSIFTAAECNEAIENLKCQLIADPGGMIGSVTINGRSVSYKSAEDLEKLISFWQRQLRLAQSSAAGVSRINPKVALFK